MAKRESTLTWTEIDPASLPEEQGALYAKYKNAYALMKVARANFEASFQAAAPAGKRIVCGYNFGKLSIALADAVPERPKAQSGTLAEWMAAQQRAGR